MLKFLTKQMYINGHDKWEEVTLHFITSCETIRKKMQVWSEILWMCSVMNNNTTCCCCPHDVWSSAFDISLQSFENGGWSKKRVFKSRAFVDTVLTYLATNSVLTKFKSRNPCVLEALNSVFLSFFTFICLSIFYLSFQRLLWRYTATKVSFAGCFHHHHHHPKTRLQGPRGYRKSIYDPLRWIWTFYHTFYVWKAVYKNTWRGI